MTTITTKSGKQIIVRSLEEGDVDAMFTYITQVGNEDTFILINPDSLITLEEEEKYVRECLEKITNKEMVKFLAFDGNTLVGVVDVTALDRRQEHIGRMGITVAKEYRGEGIGKQLMELAIEAAKNELGVSQVMLACFATNQVGLNLYNTLGFVEYGRLPKGVLYKGEYIDEVLMYKDVA